MNKYKRLPENATDLSLRYTCCDTSCCGAITFHIRGNKAGHLWDSSVLFYENCSPQSIDELRQEVIEACAYYGLKLTEDINDNCFWDWETEQ